MRKSFTPTGFEPATYGLILLPPKLPSMLAAAAQLEEKLRNPDRLDALFLFRSRHKTR